MKTSKAVPISELCVFQNEGVVETVIWVDNEAELKKAMKEHPNFYFLGKGSNTVIDPDNGAHCFVKYSNQFSEAHIQRGCLTVEAGMAVHQLAKECQKRGLSGLEFTAGVPASVGGMVAMNFGCWGHCFADIIQQVKAMDREGNVHYLTPDECEFSYRNSVFSENKWVVLEATFNLEESDPITVRDLNRANIQKRLQTQPLRSQTFGSVFKNPPGDYAGRLIESLGLKGQSFNSVCVSHQHANFFENTSSASFLELKHVIDEVQKAVWFHYQVQLELEVRLVT